VNDSRNALELWRRLLRARRATTVHICEALEPGRMHSGLNSCMAPGGLRGKPEYVAAFSLMNAFGGTFNVHAMTDEREHLRRFLDQWRRGEWLDLCAVREYWPGKDHHRVRLLHCDRGLGIHVFKPSCPSPPPKKSC